MIDFACKQFMLDDVIKCSLGLTRADFALFEFLLEHNREFSTTQLADSLKFDLSTVQRSVKKLFDHEVVIRSQVNLTGGGYVYHYKIADRNKIRSILKNIVSSWAKTVETELNRW